MKVSDPIIFGHAVRAFLPEVFDRYGAALAAAGLSPNNGLGSILAGLDVARPGRRDQGRDRAGPGRRARAGHGRLRPRDHQPARAQRRDRRRLDAGHDPHLGTHVGPGRRGARHPRGDPRLLLRRHLPGRDRRLPGQRCVRPDDDGLGAQRRADGPGRRGVRLPRQDLRDRSARHRTGRRRHRHGALDDPGRGGRHLADVPDQGHRRSRTGSSSPSPGPGPPDAGGVLARLRPGPRRQPDRQGEQYLAEHDTEGLDITDHGAGRRDRVHAGADPPGTRTPSRSPATCSATT